MKRASDGAVDRGIGVGFLQPVPPPSADRHGRHGHSIWVVYPNELRTESIMRAEGGKKTRRALNELLRMELPERSAARRGSLRMEIRVIRSAMVLPSGVCTAEGFVVGSAGARMNRRLELSADDFLRCSPSVDRPTIPVLNGLKPGPRLLGRELRIESGEAVEALGDDGKPTLRITQINPKGPDFSFRRMVVRRRLASVWETGVGTDGV